MGVGDYGIKIWDAAGSLKLDTSDRVTRMRHKVEVDLDNSDSIVLSDIDGHDSVQFAIEYWDGYHPEFAEQLVSRSGTTISWTARHDVADYGDVYNTIYVFLY